MSICAVLAIAAGFAQASYNGINSSPLGDRSSSDIGFAMWDIFPSAQITNLAGNVGDLGVTLSQSVAGSAPYGPQPGAVANDLFYTFFGASNWTISGTSSVETTSLVLQIRLSPPASGTTTAFFSPLLNGVGTTGVLTATGLDAGGMAASGYDVMQYTWSGLSIAAGQAFAVSFSNPAGGYHVGIDSISIDIAAAAVPEPSTYGLMAAALLAVVIWRRRCTLRRLAAS